MASRREPPDVSQLSVPPGEVGTVEVVMSVAEIASREVDPVLSNFVTEIHDQLEAELERDLRIRFGTALRIEIGPPTPSGSISFLVVLIALYGVITVYNELDQFAESVARKVRWLTHE